MSKLRTTRNAKKERASLRMCIDQRYVHDASREKGQLTSSSKPAKTPASHEWAEERTVPDDMAQAKLTQGTQTYIKKGQYAKKDKEHLYKR